MSGIRRSRAMPCNWAIPLMTCSGDANFRMRGGQVIPLTIADLELWAQCDILKMSSLSLFSQSNVKTRSKLLAYRICYMNRQLVYVAPFSAAVVKSTSNMEMNVAYCLVCGNSVILPDCDSGALISLINGGSRLADTYSQSTSLLVGQIQNC